VNQPDSPQPAIEGPPHLPPPIRGGYRLISRPLLLGWCLWLLVSWAINLMLDGSAAMPAVRWMLVCALVGIMIAWPVWRLSLPTPPMPTLSTLSDLFFLWLIFQVLVLRVGIDWPIDHAILIDAAVTTNGDLVPGLSAGELRIDDGLTLQPLSRTFIEIGGGPAPGVGFDLINVPNGSAAIDGDLIVSMITGCIPTPSETFAFLIADSVTGEFDNAPDGSTIPTTDGSMFRIDYQADRIVLTDFVAGPGLTAPLAGDANGDGQVTGADLSILDANFGAGVTAATSAITAVPEPTSLALIGLGGLALLRRRPA